MGLSLLRAELQRLLDQRVPSSALRDLETDERRSRLKVRVHHFVERARDGVDVQVMGGALCVGIPRPRRR